MIKAIAKNLKGWNIVAPGLIISLGAAVAICFFQYSTPASLIGTAGICMVLAGAFDIL